MESCSGSHSSGAGLARTGARGAIDAAQYVKPYLLAREKIFFFLDAVLCDE